MSINNSSIKYVDKNNKEIKPLDYVYYSDLSDSNLADGVARIDLHGEKVHFLACNDGNNNYKKINHETDLGFYSYISGNLISVCEVLRVIDIKTNFDLQYLEKHFPLDRNQIQESNVFIQVKDLVTVSFHNSQITHINNGEVISLPGKDNTWIIKNLSDNSVSYISEPCTITKLIL